jgi:hypothetical protein
LDALLRDGRKARAAAKGAKRAKISERLRKYEDDRAGLVAEAKALGFAIRDTELDIGDLDVDAREVAATPDAEKPDPTDALGQALSDIDLQQRAGVMTPEQASAAKVAALQRALGGGFGTLDQRQQWDVMGQLRDITQQAAQATSDLAAELKRNTDELARSNQIAESVVGISLREAQRALADQISGQIYGSGVGPRRGNAGSGVLARY